MKSRLFLLFLALCFIQCDDFLEEQSQSEVRPSTVSDMERILESGAYPTEAAGRLFNRKTEIFTDNVKSNMVEIGLSAQKERERWQFSWNSSMFNDDGGGEDITFWKLPYEQIKGCNLVLEYTDQMDGSEVKKEHMKGEAYVLRGLYYYMLVNFFGLPYNYGDPTAHPGVPLKLVTGVTDEKFKRNSVAECYEQILKDMELGTRLMKANQEKQSNSLLRLRYPAGYALLSRIHLHMNNWDKVILYADSVLDINAQLLDFKSHSSDPYNCGVYDENNTPIEIIWGMVEADSDELSMLSPFTPSDDLVDLYLVDLGNAIDERTNSGNIGWLKTSYWSPDEIRLLSKGTSINSYWLNGGIRTAEMYLNRAEAYIRKYIVSGNTDEAQRALDDLNELRRNRLNAAHVDKTMADFATSDALLAFCLRERRRELCYEANHRWFDLRRLGMSELKHVFLDNDNGFETEYILQKEDPRYVLPIPGEVLRRNPNLTEMASSDNNE